MKINWRNSLGISLTLSIVAILVVVLVTFDQDTIDNLGLLEPRFLMLAFLMLLAAIAVEGGRIALIGNAMGGKLGWWQGCTIFLAANFATLVSPMGMAELPTLTLLYKKAGLSTGLSAAAAVMRSFITKLVFLTAIIYLFGFKRDSINFGPITGDIFSLMALVFFLTVIINASYVLFPGLVINLWERMPQRWRRGRLGVWQQRLDLEAREFDRGLVALWRRHPFSLLLVGGLSAAYWMLFFGLLPVLARGLGLLIEPVMLVSRQFVLTLALPFIPLPGGSGALELAMVAVYQGVVPRGLIGIFVLSWRLFTYYLLLLLGGFAVLGKLWRR